MRSKYIQVMSWSRPILLEIHADELFFLPCTEREGMAAPFTVF
jgi:hypothetical protein